MKSLKLRSKFIIILLLAALPATIATTLLSRNLSESVSFAQAESEGLEYLSPLQAVYRQVGLHRIASSSSLSGNTASLSSVRRDLKSAVADLDKVHGELGEKLRLGSLWDEARADVLELIDINASVPYEEKVKKHSDVKNLLKALKGTVADYSNLILDPVLDSYYLMDAIVFRIPSTLTALNEYHVDFTEQTGSEYTIPNQYRLQEIDALSSDVVSTINTALANNSNLPAVLDRPVTRFENTVSNAMNALEKVRESSTPQLNQEAFNLTVEASMAGYELYDLTMVELKELLRNRIEEDSKERQGVLAFVIGTVLFCIFFTYMVGRNITAAIIRAKTLAEAIADDKLDNEINVNSKSKDEPAQLLGTLAIMQDKLKARIEHERELSITNGRIKQALECVSSPVLVADIENKIIYQNLAANTFFQTYDAALRKDITGFSPDDIIGRPFNFINPAVITHTHVQTDSSEYECVVGQRHLLIAINPVFDELGEVQGSVVELHDRSDQIIVEQAVVKDVYGLVEQVLKGNLSVQVDSEGKPEFLIPVYKGINEMVHVCNSVISNVGELFKHLAAGDLRKSWEADPQLDLQGDFQQLRTDANTTVSQLSGLISHLKEDALVVRKSVDKVVNVNSQLENNAQGASQQADSALVDVTSISNNVDSIAGAAEQMNASIKEIVKNTSNSNTVATDAVNLTQAADKRISQLASSSNDIGAMVKVINSIAEQTNLLALNATIEAARAGEAGKGFAVVANEVKELAKETAKATEDIAEKIRTIQSDSESAATGIREIDGIVQKIKSLHTDTDTAMQQQSAATQEIARSINSVASGTSGVSNALSDLVTGTEETTGAVRTVKEEVTALSEVSGNLQTLVDNFKVAEASENDT